MSRLLQQLQGTSLADVQRGGPGNLASQDGTQVAGKGSPPETPPDQTPELPPGPTTDQPTVIAGASAVETPKQGSGHASQPGSKEGSQHADKPPSKRPRRHASQQPSVQESLHASGDAGLAESLQASIPRTIIKRTFDLDAGISARLDEAVKAFPRGAQRKIVEYALDNALTEIGF